MSELPPLEILDIEVPESSLKYMNTPFTVTLNRAPEYVYDWFNDDHTIVVGQDGIAYENLSYGKPSPSFEAFAGRPFDIALKDGSVIHAKGDWWSGSTFPVEIEMCGYRLPEGDWRYRRHSVCLSREAIVRWLLRDRARKAVAA
jgi:hypothetical protein